MTTQFVDVDLNPAATEDAHRQAVADGFIDDQFAPLDLRSGPQAMADALSPIVDEHPEFAPTPEEIEAADGPAAPPQVPVATPPAAPQPEVFEFEDGSSVTVQKTNNKWCAVLNTGNNKQERFFGRTKDELLTNVLAAKVHATRKINELNKKLKLTARPEPPVAQPQPEVKPNFRDLTADEVFEIKNQLAANPDLAFSNWFQKKTGLSLDQLVGIIEQGRHAKDELDSEAVAKAFMQQNPDYYADPKWENYTALVGYLSKNKLHKTLTTTNHDEIFRGLLRGGHWTVENLEEAFNELSEDGLLVMAPNAASDPEEEEEEETPQAPPPAPPAPPAPATPPAAPAPTTTPANPRIAGKRVGQRAGLGLRSSQTTVVRPPDTTQPPSADELDNLSDAQIQELFSGVRRVAAQSARR